MEDKRERKRQAMKEFIPNLNLFLFSWGKGYLFLQIFNPCPNVKANITLLVLVKRKTPRNLENKK